MSRLKSNLITAGIALALLLLLMIGLVFVPFRSPDAVQVSFLGYANDALAGKLAMFVVTNTSNEKITVMPDEPQMFAYSGWPHAQINGDVQIIAPHAATNFTVMGITNQAIWRQPVFWIYTDGSKIEYLQNSVKINLQLNWLRINHGLIPRLDGNLGGSGYRSFSETITNK